MRRLQDDGHIPARLSDIVEQQRQVRWPCYSGPPPCPLTHIRTPLQNAYMHQQRKCAALDATQPPCTYTA